MTKPDSKQRKFKHLFYSLWILSLCAFSFIETEAAFEYSTGRKIIRLVAFENRGLVFESWEGVAEEATCDKSVSCDEEKKNCYAPGKKTFAFSVNKDNAHVINFMRKNVQKEMLIEYKIHRVEAISLSSDFEVKEVYAIQKTPPDKFLRKKTAPKSGSRNFSVYGKVLSLEYRGLAKTYEGLYYDAKRQKVHPFSIKDKIMAIYVLDTMFFSAPFYIGFSKSEFFDGIRESDLDIFEINYDEEAGAIDTLKSGQ